MLTVPNQTSPPLTEAPTYLPRGAVVPTGTIPGPSLPESLTVSTGVMCEEGADGPPGNCSGTAPHYPLMHRSRADLDEEEAEFRSRETYAAPAQKDLSADSGTGSPSRSLLSYISYVPSERNQGSCGNCWVWASTGALEIDHAVKTGINTRLSTQYFNSKFKNGAGDDWACCGGNLQIFTSWYNTDKSVIPWSNTNAAYGDTGRTCGSGATAVPLASLSVTPDYDLESISDSVIATTGVGQSAAIANIKSAIDNNKAVYYSYHFGSSGWTAFYYNWSHEPEPVIFDPDSFGGQEDAGGHGVLIVGYNTSDAANPYWVVLNSWGTTAGRPNGLFRLKMNMNYDNKYTYSGSPFYYQHKFYVLNAAFKESTMPAPAPTISSITPETGLNATSLPVVNLAGTGFYGTPAVKLNRSGFSDIPATDVTVVSPTRITCTFPLTGVPAGLYTAVVTNPDGQQGLLVNGFTILRPVQDKIGIFQNGSWYIDRNGDGVWNAGDQNYGFGAPLWTPVIGDWNQDGNTEIGVYHDGAWYLDYDASGWWSAGDKNYGYGAPGWTPVTGDWNGDGKDKIGVFKDGAWYLDYDGSGTWNAGDRNFAFGGAGWTPVTGKWTADKKSKVGVYNDGVYYLDYTGDNVYGAGDKTIIFGDTGSTAVTGDWNADGRTEVGTKTGSLWRIDYDGLGAINASTKTSLFGAADWNPITGDWNADGRDEIALYEDGAWYLDEDGNGVWDAGIDRNYAFGTTGWIPVVGKWS